MRHEMHPKYPLISFFVSTAVQDVVLAQLNNPVMFPVVIVDLRPTTRGFYLLVTGNPMSKGSTR